MPGFIKLQFATLKTKAPKGDLWLHEIKYDGYRAQVHLNRGRKKVFTRSGLAARVVTSEELEATVVIGTRSR